MSANTMAHKRSLENNMDGVNTKVIKLLEEIDCDVTLDSVSLAIDLKTSLEYDSVLKTFSISLEKERKDGDRFICIGEEEMQNVVKLLPVVEKLSRRYSSKRSPRIIDIPFEACSGGVGDLVTVVSLKENTFKKRYFDVDIRKCIKKEDSYQYTSEGVRIHQSLISTLRENLLSYQSLIVQAREKTKEVISMAMATTIIRQIQELADPRHHCHGCQNDQPSQKQHMGYGGCMSFEQATWDDQTSQYWQAANSLVIEDDVQTLAKQAASHLPDIQALSLQIPFPTTT